MDPKKELHLKRLRQSLNRIPTLMSEGRSPYDVEFKEWYDQTRRSFTEIFGDGSSYCRDFLRLLFKESRIYIGKPTGPSLKDREIFAESMKRAERIIAAAIEEAEIPARGPEPTPQQASMPSPQIVVNITNTLSQVTNVDIAQVLQNLNNLGLIAAQKQEAERLAKELDAEAKGQKRWEIMGPCLQKLKALGKSVYENVALPLLTDLIKKELGMG